MINKVGTPRVSLKRAVANTKDKWFANGFSPVPSFRTRGRPRRQWKVDGTWPGPLKMSALLHDMAWPAWHMGHVAVDDGRRPASPGPRRRLSLQTSGGLVTAVGAIRRRRTRLLTVNAVPCCQASKKAVVPPAPPTSFTWARTAWPWLHSTQLCLPPQQTRRKSWARVASPDIKSSTAQRPIQPRSLSCPMGIRSCCTWHSPTPAPTPANLALPDPARSTPVAEPPQAL